MTDVASQGPAPSEEDRPVLTNRQGHPVYDNQNQRTVGARGPATLENYQFLEKISHFDRERIPERVVHARGATAFGTFVADGTVGDEPVAAYTRAKLFQTAGKETEVAVRFSTVAGGRDSSEAARDPRGFAVKFYTDDGNWELDQGPEITGRLTRQRIPRTDDYTQAGQRYLLSEDWERDDLVANAVEALSLCDRGI